MKKIHALIPEEREKECPREWGRWNGTIPCTGKYICTMCGTELIPHTSQPKEKQIEVLRRLRDAIISYHSSGFLAINPYPPLTSALKEADEALADS